MINIDQFANSLTYYLSKAACKLGYSAGPVTLWWVLRMRHRHCGNRYSENTVNSLLVVRITTNDFVRIMFLFCVWNDIISAKVYKTSIS